MRVVWLLPVLGVSACGTLPEGQTQSPPTEPPPTIAAARPAKPTTSSESFEDRHRTLAQKHAKEGNWADALVHWELLTLLRPNSEDYRTAASELRTRINSRTATFMQNAEQARKQGNLDQAELWYLRVLYLDREHSGATQALREMEAERTRRAYGNRPPRMRMQ